MNYGLIALLGIGLYGLYLSSKSATAAQQQSAAAAQGNNLLSQLTKALTNQTQQKPPAGTPAGGGGSSGGGSGAGAGGAGTAGQPGSGETNFLDWLNLANPNQTIDPISTPSTDDTTLLEEDTTPISDAGIYATVDPFGGADQNTVLVGGVVDTSGEDPWQSDYFDPASVTDPSVIDVSDEGY